MLVLQVHIDRLLKGMAEARNLMCGKAQEGEFFMQGKDFNGKDCMSFDGFCACVRMDIQRRLGGGFIVEERIVAKNNDTRCKAMIIREHESCIGPSIYMENFYQTYRDGESLQDVEDSVLLAYQKRVPEEKFDIAFLKEWEKVKRKVIYKLVNYDRNRKLLKDVPHRRFLDLAIVYECFLGAEDEGCATMLIHNRHMESWRVTEDELHTEAFRNTPELAGSILDSMEKVMLELLDDGELKLDRIENLPARDTSPMLVLTNRYKFHGAGCILYKNLLKEIAEKWKCDICILPSSINETILLPMNRVESCVRLDWLAQMVRDINRTQVMPDEVLSDHVYQYIRGAEKIIMQEEERI